MFRLSITCALVLVAITLVTMAGSVSAQDNPQLQNSTSVHLRSRDGFDVVGTNSDGVTFALDSASGVALWSFRTRRPVISVPPPVIINSRSGTDDVLIFDGPSAIKIEGRTGRELWRSPLAAAPSSAIASSDASGPIIIIIDNSLRRLVVLSGLSGNLISQTLLPARVVGAP